MRAAEMPRSRARSRRNASDELPSAKSDRIPKQVLSRWGSEPRAAGAGDGSIDALLGRGSRAASTARIEAALGTVASQKTVRSSRPVAKRAEATRSEEHTSELQSPLN